MRRALSLASVSFRRRAQLWNTSTCCASRAWMVRRSVSISWRGSTMMYECSRCGARELSWVLFLSCWSMSARRAGLQMVGSYTPHSVAALARVLSSRVAETRTVWRPPSTFLPVWVTMRTISSWYCLAKRWSASSRTRILQWCVPSTPNLESSKTRPGVPTTSMGFFLRMSSICLLMLAPPMACWTIHRPVSPRTFSASRTICMASSRDGATTSAWTPSPAVLFSRSRRH
mmetsp:Transcript_31294/g.99842  ORF Transcript_31294/g.99842 Transcript_31294/m.99842 type:complete len:230 (+) Transcript_31294:812-1501(+)